MTTELKAGERIDDLQRSNLKIIQSTGKFCFGMDAVLLSGFVRIRLGSRVLDMGTGTGILPLLLSAKTQAAHLTGLEIQPESADMARRSVLLNHLEEKIAIVEGDLKEASALFGSAAFDAVTCNPPYMIGAHGLKSQETPKAIARHELLCNLDDVVKAAADSLKVRGRFFMVHRPHRLTDIMCVLREHKLEPKRIRFVQPYADREPNMVLVEAVRSGKPMIKVMPMLVIYNSDGTYTQETLDIYYN